MMIHQSMEFNDDQSSSDNDSPCTNGEATDSESMDEESGNVSYELEYQKNCRLYSDYLT